MKIEDIALCFIYWATVCVFAFAVYAFGTIMANGAGANIEFKYCALIALVGIPVSIALLKSAERQQRERGEMR